MKKPLSVIVEWMLSGPVYADVQLDMTKILGLTVTALGLMLAGNTEVRGAEASHLKLTRPMVIAGVDLQAAVYDVQWDLKGTRATVRFSREGRVVATVQGERATFDRSVPNNTLYFSKDPDGFLAIRALRFASTNKGIVFPLVRSHLHPPTDNPMGNSLMEENWRNHTPRVPKVYK
jgi:hypothetical protein